MQGYDNLCTSGPDLMTTMLLNNLFGVLTVVNDGAERCVRAITDFAQATGDSIYQEDILLIGNSHQEVFQDLQKAALARLNP